MKHSIYSFLDLAGAIAHPLYPLGIFQFTGLGVGSVTVSMTIDRSVHDLAADGSVMISKVAGNNGQISIECQQTSIVHKYLLALYNYLIAESAEKWALTTIVLRNVADGTSHIATGVSFTKVPDKPYQAQGQKVTWVLMAADIQNATM